MQSNTTFYLLRHAESAPERNLPEEDWPLSLLGTEQAQALVPTLQGLGITRLISSPYLRARQTVAPFAHRAGLEVLIEEDLRERKLAGGYDMDWEILIRRAWADHDYRGPGGESGLECQKRVAASVARWIERCPG